MPPWGTSIPSSLTCVPGIAWGPNKLVPGRAVQPWLPRLPQEGGHGWVTGLMLCVHQPPCLAPPGSTFFRGKAKLMSHPLGSVLFSRGSCLTTALMVPIVGSVCLGALGPGPSLAQVPVDSYYITPDATPPRGDHHGHSCQPLLAPGPLHTSPHLIHMTARETGTATTRTTDAKTPPPPPRPAAKGSYHMAGPALSDSKALLPQLWPGILWHAESRSSTQGENAKCGKGSPLSLPTQQDGWLGRALDGWIRQAPMENSGRCRWGREKRFQMEDMWGPRAPRAGKVSVTYSRPLSPPGPHPTEARGTADVRGTRFQKKHRQWALTPTSRRLAGRESTRAKWRAVKPVFPTQ